MTVFLDLLKRGRNLRMRYDTLINSECAKSELNEIINYLLEKYSVVFEDKLLPGGKEKKDI